MKRDKDRAIRLDRFRDTLITVILASPTRDLSVRQLAVLLAKVRRVR